MPDCELPEPSSAPDLIADAVHEAETFAATIGVSSEQIRRLAMILLDSSNDYAEIAEYVDLEPGGQSPVPGHDQSHADALALLTHWRAFGGYPGFDTYTEAHQVADMLRAHYERQGAAHTESPSGTGRRADALNGNPVLTFGWESNSDGQIGSWSIGCYLGFSADAYLLANHDIKHLTDDREATGWAAALAYATSIDGAFRAVLARTSGLGLLPLGDPDAGLALRPEANRVGAPPPCATTHARDLQRWREAVAAGATALGFRMWLHTHPSTDPP